MIACLVTPSPPQELAGLFPIDILSRELNIALLCKSFTSDLYVNSGRGRSLNHNDFVG